MFKLTKEMQKQKIFAAPPLHVDCIDTRSAIASIKSGPKALLATWISLCGKTLCLVGFLFLEGCSSLSTKPAPVEILMPGDKGQNSNRATVAPQKWTPFTTRSVSPRKEPENSKTTQPSELFLTKKSFLDLPQEKTTAKKIIEKPQEKEADEVTSNMITPDFEKEESLHQKPVFSVPQTPTSEPPKKSTPPDFSTTEKKPVETRPETLEKKTAPSTEGSSVAQTNLSGLSFLWPISGRIQTAYGATADGLFNDGINIRARKGTPIRAAESGVVTFVGENVKAYGTIVLVRHAHGWASAYAHIQKTLAKKGDTIKRGQIIAYSGDSGQVPNPQLHFELRYQRRPVNPERYLSPQ